MCETKTAAGAAAQSMSNERKLESEKGRWFQRKTYREEASRRPIFLTLKLYPTGIVWVKVNGMRTQISWWRGENTLTALLPTLLAGPCPW